MQTLLCLLYIATHSIYISVIDIVINVEDEHDQIVVKVFADDLQAAVYNESSKHIDIQKSPDGEDVSSISQYFDNHIVLKNSDGNLGLEIAKVDKEADTFWIYFNLSIAIEESDSLSFSADFFQELFPTQTHIINARINDRSVYQKLTAKKTSLDLL